MFELMVVLHNLRQHPLRSCLTGCGLAVAVTAVVALVGIADRFEDAFLELYDERGADLVVQRTGGTVQLSIGIDQRIGDRIRALPHVRSVIGSLMDLVSFEQANLIAVVVNGWPPDSPVLDLVTIVSGRRLKPGDGRAVMLGKVLAANLGKTTGDKVEIYGEPFEVVGVFDSFSIYESGAVFFLLDELQRLTNRPGHVTGYIVDIDKSDGHNHVDQVRHEIEGLDKNLAVVPTGEFVESIAQIRVIRSMAWVTSFVAVILGAIGVSNTMVMSVLERRQEIGTLRALGWRTVRVVRLIVAEACVLCLCGAVIGSLLGIGTIKLLARLPATSGLIDGHLGLPVLAQACGLAMLSGLLGAIYPAVWASCRTPLDGLRSK
jgi:putative ABC transport system permease protein